MASVSGFNIAQILQASPCTLFSINEDEPIISAGLHLSQLDVEGVVATDKDGKADGVILGYNVLRLLNPKTLWTTFYQTKIVDSKMRVLLVKPGDEVRGVFKRILDHGWGYAIVVDAAGKPKNLIGLLDIANFMIKSGFSAVVKNTRVRERGSNPLVTTTESATVLAAIGVMLDKHVRRLFVRESELILSDRGLIKWILSPANVGRLRDSPQEVLGSPVSSMRPMLHKPSFVEYDTDAATALKKIYDEDARCLITNDRKMILTPWDLTISLVVK